jgi:hypothetical protein
MDTRNENIYLRSLELVGLGNNINWHITRTVMMRSSSAVPAHLTRP